MDSSIPPVVQMEKSGTNNQPHKECCLVQEECIIKRKTPQDICKKI